MRTFVTSDLHLDHANIIKYCPTTRGHFKSVDEMNHSIITDWNNNVEPTDLTYILGDVAFAKVDRTVELLSKLNGKKILIVGNHDSHLLKHSKFVNCFESVHQYLEVNYNGHKLVMFHFPINEWHQAHRGSIHFFGHCHQNLLQIENYRAFNVGYDATGKVVSLLDDMIAKALTGQLKPHH